MCQRFQTLLVRLVRRFSVPEQSFLVFMHHGGYCFLVRHRRF